MVTRNAADNQFHRALLRVIGILEIILAVIVLLSIYLSHPHGPSPLDSINNKIFNYFSYLSPSTNLLLIGLMVITGIGLIAQFRWAWWAEINLGFLRIIYLSLLLYLAPKLSILIPFFEPLIIELYLGLAIGILVYLFYLKFTINDMFKEMPHSRPLMILFTILVAAILIIKVRFYFILGLLKA